MSKISYSEQIRSGYNYLAGRVNELKTENKKLKKEIAELKADILRANFGGRLPCNNGGIQDARWIHMARCAWRFVSNGVRPVGLDPVLITNQAKPYRPQSGAGFFVPNAENLAFAGLFQKCHLLARKRTATAFSLPAGVVTHPKNKTSNFIVNVKLQFYKKSINQ